MPEEQHEPDSVSLWEKLPACEYGVFDGGSPTLDGTCGESAAERVSWDGGRTWFYACEKHAVAIHAQEEDEG